MGYSDGLTGRSDSRSRFAARFKWTLTVSAEQLSWAAISVLVLSSNQ